MVESSLDPHLNSSEAEIHLDGVIYAEWPHGLAKVRIGATNPYYLEALLCASNDSLSQKGIFVGQGETVSPMAVMCEGMGAVWPHMGRELYDQFPKAREAMDQLQSVASWDLLGLLDSCDLALINSTRYQIPYLFLLEYAEWSYLCSLGFKPAMLCGHSLGELIALCCAGIYDYKVAWHILDTRALHVASLEAHSEQNFGMLAVHAEKTKVQEVLNTWPEARVANYNTPSQFILGGPKEILQAIRGFLRKQRIPAVSIPVSLWFHHPWMRILRDLSFVRLKGLKMQPPSIPVLGVASETLYPKTQPEICSTILDLDENPVRFSSLVSTMWQNYGIRTFLELGPTDILCGLVSDNQAQAEVLACNHKNHEAKSLRELVARLYARGYLAKAKIVAQSQNYPQVKPIDNDHSSLEEDLNLKDLSTEDQELYALISNLTKIKVADLRPNLDLRLDLRLRSSSFPRLISEAEKIFKITPDYEELLQVVTLGDLAKVLRGESLKKSPKSLNLKKLERLSPLGSYVLKEGTLTQASFLEKRSLLKELIKKEAKLRLENLGVVFFSLGSYPKAFSQNLWEELLLGFSPLVSELQVPEGLDPKVFQDLISKPQIFLAKDSELKLKSHLLGALIILGEDFSLSNLNDDLVSLHNYSLKFRQPLNLLILRLHSSLDKALANLASFNLYSKIVKKLNNLKLDLKIVEYVVETKARRYVELGDFLVRELFLGANPKVLVAKATQVENLNLEALNLSKKLILNLPPSCGKILKSNQAYALVPSRKKASLLSVKQFQGTAYFKNDFLSQHKVIPVSQILSLLIEASYALIPWLKVVSLSDIILTKPWPLNRSAGCEAEVSLEALSWLTINQTATRKCQGTVKAKTLNAQGRMTGDLSLLGLGTVWMGLSKIASNQRLEGLKELKSCDLAPKFKASFLEACDFSFEVKRLVFEQDQGVAWLEKSLLAGDMACERYFCQIMELICQILAYSLNCKGEKDTWVLTQIGFILLGAFDKFDPKRLYFKTTWKTDNLWRYDVELLDNLDQVLLSIFHLEWRKINA
ncbi:MAG: acyltransferase domain-containing protein [Desulfovibrionaceae bacterium]|nr:acyltransferase domain-containing protein [Desulfovibrionaceae bacterium]